MLRVTILLFVYFLPLCSTRDETVYKFWTQTVDLNLCRNTQFVSYADLFLANNCDISYEDGSQILKRTLCHATSLAAALICSDPGFPETSQISGGGWGSNLNISEICGSEGLVKFSNVGLFQDKSDSDLSENLHKILGDCNSICQESPQMLNVCSTFIRFCRVAFTPEVANSAVKQAKDNENIAKEDPPETPNQSEAVVKGDDKVASDADGAKANQAAPMKAESNSGSFANEVDKDAAVERALFNTIKNTGSEMVEASADSKFASSLNGSDKRKLSDLNSLNFYTSEGESASASEYVPWFLLIGFVVIILYALTLKKNRVIACIVEGKRPKRANRTSSSFHHNGEIKGSSESHHFRLELDDSDEEEANTFNDAAPMLKNF